MTRARAGWTERTAALLLFVSVVAYLVIQPRNLTNPVPFFIVEQRLCAIFRVEPGDLEKTFLGNLIEDCTSN